MALEVAAAQKFDRSRLSPEIERAIQIASFGII
jgi:hypothetical protein